MGSSLSPVDISLSLRPVKNPHKKISMLNKL